MGQIGFHLIYEYIALAIGNKDTKRPRLVCPD